MTDIKKDINTYSIISKAKYYPPMIKLDKNVFYDTNTLLVYSNKYDSKNNIYYMEQLNYNIWIIGYSIEQNNTLSYNIEKDIIYPTTFNNDIWNDDIFNIWDPILGQNIEKYNNYKKNHFNEIQMWQETHKPEYLIEARKKDIHNII